MADTLARAGRDRDALALIARLLGEMSDPEMGIYVSELWRIRGELVARERGGDVALAEHSLQGALRIARGQEATLLQSKAGISLARYLAERGRREEAKTALDRSGVSALADRATPEIVAADRLSAELG
jgi:hypothetical protein